MGTLKINGDLLLPAYDLLMTWNGKNLPVINHHTNGNLSINSLGGSLHLGYQNTSEIYCRSGNYLNLDVGNYFNYALPLSGGTISGRVTFSAQDNTTNPAGQTIFLNGVSGSTDTAKAPGIGFHIGEVNWGSLKFLADGSFRFYNDGCSAYMPVYASTFFGNLSGNASTASKWLTPRTLTLAGAINGAVTFDGSGNMKLVAKNSYASRRLADAASGYHLITINSDNHWMSAFTIRVYQSYQWYDIVVSGYNYGEYHWHDPQAILMGSTQSAITVYFGYTDTWKLWVAIPASHYYGIDILDVTNGYIAFDSYEDLFTITNVSSLPGTIQSTQTIYRPWYSNETVGNSDTVDGKHASDFAAASHSHDNYLPISGGVLTGGLRTYSTNGIWCRHVNGNNTEFGGDLYLNYAANAPIYVGNTGGYYISADGSFYTGSCNYANNAGVAGNVSWSNISGKPFGNHYFLGTAYHWSSGLLIDCGSASSYRMIAIHLTGNGYGAGTPIDSWFNFYDYTAAGSNIINYHGINNGCYMGPMRVYIHGGRLWAWINQSSDYQTINVEMICNTENDPKLYNSYFHESGYNNLITIYPNTSVSESYGSSFPTATHTGQVFFMI